MKLKLDENLGLRGAAQLRAGGHDVATIVDQRMSSAPDLAVIEACRIEGRVLVTLDLDFANPLRFPPASYAGIAVLRPSVPLGSANLDDLVQTLAEALSRSSVAGKLWIVEYGRIREHTPTPGEG